MTVSLTELLWTQAWSGAPFYLMAAVGQGLWLHRAGFALPAIAATAALSTALTILLGVVLWGRLFAGMGSGVMLGGVINLPAALASIVVFPVVAAVVRHGFQE